MKITLVSIYGPNANQKHYIKKVLRKVNEYAEGEVLIAGDYNMELTSQRCKGNSKLNIDEYGLMDLMNIESGVSKYTYYSGRHNTYSKMDYILGKKTNKIQ
uniref:Endonuclease/exonuclease/phosphatase domain-containing protein n=1 Tax=Salvator merianae TaxID=96440 RepID=A0A8D0B2W2_SALMN